MASKHCSACGATGRRWVAQVKRCKSCDGSGWHNPDYVPPVKTGSSEATPKKLHKPGDWVPLPMAILGAVLMLGQSGGNSVIWIDLLIGFFGGAFVGHAINLVLGRWTTPVVLGGLALWWWLAR